MRSEPSAERSLTETLTAPADAGHDLVAGRYRIVKGIGHGASKAVYLAEDTVLDREVALALVNGSARDPAIRERLAREAQVMGRLGDHRHVVTIYDVGEAAGAPFIVTRYMAQGSLAQRLAAAPQRRLPVADAVRLTAQVADALAYAHERGVIHRDVKPDNIWLAADGSAGLGDFGIAHSARHAPLAGPGALLGTAIYMSPEQAAGEEATAASDLYSLGVTLFELLCGAPPFVADETLAVLDRHRSAEPPRPGELNPEVPEQLERLVLALLAKAPAARPGSAAAVREALDGAPGAAATTPRGRRPTDLIGRGPEMEALSDALRRAADGAGRFVALTGPPGIGKTRLAQELAAEAEEAGAAVVWGRCADERGAPPYWPWVQLLRALPRAVRRCPAFPPEVARLLPERRKGDDAAEPVDPEAAQFALFEATAALLRRAASARPLVVVLDDLQFADRLSLRLLAHVAGELGGARLLVVGTYRASPGRPGRAREALAELGGVPAERRIELGGLVDADVAEVLETAAGIDDAALVRALQRHTGGNPFFVRELARMLAAEGGIPGTAGTSEAALAALVPSSVAEVVRRRLAAVGEGTAAVLDAASVQGVEFDARAVAAAAGLTLADVWTGIESARDEGLVEELAEAAGDRWRFTHAIIRDVVSADLATSRRARMQLALGRFLEERRSHGAAVEPAELARHFGAAAAVLGEEGERAVRFACEAAERAMALQSYAQAAHHWARAFAATDALPWPSDAERCELLLRQADAETHAGDAEAGKRIFLRAAAIARRLDSPEPLARAALGYAEWGSYGAAHVQAIGLLEEALARLPEADSHTRASVLGRLAARHDPLTHQHERERLAAEATAMARRLGDDRGLATMLTIGLLVEWRPERRAARRAAAAEAIALAAASGVHQGALWAHVVRFVDAFGDGSIAAADAELDAYEHLAEQLRRPYYRWYLMMLRATRAAFAGAHEEADALAGGAFKLISGMEEDCAQEHTVQRFMLARVTGRPELAPADELHRYAARYARLPLWRAMSAAADAELGRTEQARAALEDCVGGAGERLRSDPDGLSVLALLGEACATIGDAERSRLLGDLLAPHAEANLVTERGWAAWGAVARVLGRLAAACGEHERAAAHFARALELNRAWGAAPWVLHTILDEARAPGPAPARDRLAEAAAIAAELRLPALERRAREAA